MSGENLDTLINFFTKPRQPDTSSGKRTRANTQLVLEQFCGQDKAMFAKFVARIERYQRNQLTEHEKKLLFTDLTKLYHDYSQQFINPSSGEDQSRIIDDDILEIVTEVPYRDIEGGRVENSSQYNPDRFELVQLMARQSRSVSTRNSRRKIEELRKSAGSPNSWSYK